MDKQTIVSKVGAALVKLYESDAPLISNDLNERSITHKLAGYIKDEFTDYDVDCEYNRMESKNADEGYITKTLNLTIENNVRSDDTMAKTVFPDIIVHKRMQDDNNILVIEVKKTNNSRARDRDLAKLKAFTVQLGYEWGLYIELGLNIEAVTYKWFKDGNEIE